jgi:hypothetical protein
LAFVLLKIDRGREVELNAAAAAAAAAAAPSAEWLRLRIWSCTWNCGKVVGKHCWEAITMMVP